MYILFCLSIKKKKKKIILPGVAAHSMIIAPIGQQLRGSGPDNVHLATIILKRKYDL